MIAFLVAAFAAAPFQIFQMTPHAAAVIDVRTLADLPNGQKRFELIAIFADPTSFEGRAMRLSATPYTIDCVKGRLYYGVTTYKTAEGEVLVTDTEADHTGQWEAAPGGSMIGAARTWACTGATPDKLPAFGSLKDAETNYLRTLGH